MPVRVVTDSTADLPYGLASELGICVVPLSVVFGDNVYREGLDINHDQFYEKLAVSKSLPTTAAPPVLDFTTAYERLLTEDSTDGIISIHLSGKLSATYANACQAAAPLRETGARIEVVDSTSGSLGIGFLVIRAARAAARGATLEQVTAEVDERIAGVRVTFVLDTLEYLRRGGRIGRARAFLGHLLSIKPILAIREGEVHPGERVRTRAAAVERLFQIGSADTGVEELAVAYSTTPAEAELLRQRLAAAFPRLPVYTTRIGPVLGTHVGPGALGVGTVTRRSS